MLELKVDVIIVDQKLIQFMISHELYINTPARRLQVPQVVAQQVQVNKSKPTLQKVTIHLLPGASCYLCLLCSN